MAETYDDCALVLDEADCWTLLRCQKLGRLAFQLGDEIHIVPLNYVVDDAALLFRTAPGEKLLSVVLTASAAFEIDTIGPDEATSVVVRGPVRVLEEDEAHRADLLPLHPWVGEERYDVVELRPTVVIGRAYRPKRPQEPDHGPDPVGGRPDER